jgi:hypothetical protein
VPQSGPDFGKILTANEIAGLVSGAIWKPAESFTVSKDTQVSLVSRKLSMNLQTPLLGFQVDSPREGRTWLKFSTLKAGTSRIR